jgi:hypothetical protein
MVRDFCLHPDVLWVERPDGSARLLHLDGNTCLLDPESASLFRSILERGVDRSSSDLASSCSADLAKVRADVGAFVVELGKQRIIRRARVSHAEHLERRACVALVRGVLKAIDSPKHSLERRARRLLFLARWAAAVFGWSVTQAAWDAAYPQPATAGARHDAMIDRIDKVVRDAAAQSLLKFECKERALVCVALGREAGVHAELVLGVAFMPMRAHVWVESGDRIFSDDADHCREFERIPLRPGLASSTR